MRVVIVTGSRHHAGDELIDRVLSDERPDLVVQGGANGADAIAKTWCAKTNTPWCVVPAEWDTYGKMAGKIRNEKMLCMFPFAKVLAFPLKEFPCSGTWDCVGRAKDKGMDVRIIEP